MILDKKDIQQIRTVVKDEVMGVEERLTKKIDAIDKKVDAVDKKVDSAEKQLIKKINDSENRVIAVISREVADLAEINCEVIKRVDRIEELEKRIIRLEEKIGLTAV